MLNSLLASGVALSALLLLSGCGDDAALAAQNLRSEIAAHQAVTSTSSVSEEEAGCVAQGLVDEVGVERLRAYDILTDDLKVNLGLESVQMSTADARAAAGVFLDCLDVHDLLELYVSAGGNATGLTSKQQECLGDTTAENLVEEIMVAGFEGRRSEANDRLRERMTDCALTRS